MAKVTTLDIVKHDGEAYVKEARMAEVGEKIIVVKSVDCRYENGEVFEVAIAHDNRGGIYTKPENGRLDYFMYGSEYNVLVPLKSGTKITVEGVEYEASNLAPGIADLIVVVDAYEIGWVDDYGVYPVYLDNSGVVTFYDNDGDERNLPKWLDDGAILTLIPVAKSNETNESDPKEGDDMMDVIVHEGVKYRKVEREVREGDKYIVCTTDAFSFLTEGKVYAITNIDEDGDPLFIDDDGDASVVVSENYAVLEQIPQSIDEQIAEAERQLAELKAAKAEQERLKVGDYAVVLSVCGGNIGGVVEGDVVKITGESYGGARWIYDTLTENQASMYKERFRKATPEEVAEAKRKLAEQQAKKAEEAKWSAIGRKVGEIRKGDIVLVVPGKISLGHPVGVIGIAVEDESDGAPLVMYGGNTLYCNVKLVVPVEQRFDKGA